MNHDKKVHALSADVSALKTIVSHVLTRIGQLDPVLASAVVDGFRDALHHLQGLKAAPRRQGLDDHRTRALATVRTLLATVLSELNESRTSPGRKRRL